MGDALASYSDWGGVNCKSCGDEFDGPLRDSPRVPCVARGASAEPYRLRALAWQAQRMLVRGAHSAQEVGPCVHLAGAFAHGVLYAV